MNKTALTISRIKRLLDKVKPDRIQEVEDFVEFLSEKGSSGKGERKIAKLKGIWKGLGFENLDLDAEIKTTRKEFDLRSTQNPHPRGVVRRAPPHERRPTW